MLNQRTRLNEKLVTSKTKAGGLLEPRDSKSDWIAWEDQKERMERNERQMIDRQIEDNKYIIGRSLLYTLKSLTITFLYIYYI